MINKYRVFDDPDISMRELIATVVEFCWDAPVAYANLRLFSCCLLPTGNQSSVR